jgi:hypothetical protein
MADETPDQTDKTEAQTALLAAIKQLAADAGRTSLPADGSAHCAAAARDLAHAWLILEQPVNYAKSALIR